VCYLFTIYRTIPNLYIPVYHRYTGLLALFFTYFSFLKASFADPGFVTQKNVKDFENSFPYDDLMNISGRKCTTCNIIRPARSKHSPLTGKCVSKFDHYCGWLNNDVGEWNYRWFHLYLISNFLLIAYAIYIYVMSLLSIVDSEDLWNATFMTQNGEKVSASLAIVIQYMLARHMIVIAQLFFIAACGMMIFGFWAYHFFLVCTNTTTSETFRKKDLLQLWNVVNKYVAARKKKGETKIDMQALYDELYKIEDSTEEKTYHDEEHKQTEQTKQQVRKEWKMKTLEKMAQMIQDKEPLYLSTYDRGVWQNIMEVVFPPSLRKKKSKFN